MATPLLVVTPNPKFGELIRASLEQTQSYRVFVVSTKAAAIVGADEESCRMAFLDLDLGEQWVEEIGRSLRTVVPNMKLFLVAGDETPAPFDEIRPWTLIRKPFHLPDVLSTLARPLQGPLDEARRATAPFIFPWLDDLNKAAQHLTRLTLESSSQAALITRDNEVWAYAGELSHDAAQEVAGVMSRNWDSETRGDLLRFARLETTRAEHILYATHVGPGMLLGLVFDAETPFGTIRSQAGKLGSLLHDEEAQPEAVSTTPLKWSPAAPPVAREQAIAEDEAEEEGPVPPITQILQDIPQPDPERGGSTRLTTANAVAGVGSELMPARSGIASAPPARPTVDTGETRRSTLTREPTAGGLLNRVYTARQGPPDLGQTAISRRATATEGANGTPGASPPSSGQTQPRPERPVGPPPPGEIEATLPHSMVGFAGPGADATRIVLEPASAGVYHLTYACLLVPRFSEHHLTGEVADKLSEWMPILCVAFGWRLEFLAVRPEYLQWVANVPPATSPGYVMRVMRQQTSEKILRSFPRLKTDNLADDFWAPGYLIMGGAQPHPSQLVKDYIRQVRQRQGKK
jgi:REP element-mobilizing transposase RayT